ncbi:MAG TPA: phosphodiesterase [Chitinophagaceae bacterium]|nr:phosphodiesterase [Chitinophagaceae bacterium]
MKHCLTLFLAALLALKALAQSPKTIVAGPMLGHIEFRSGMLWVELEKGATGKATAVSPYGKSFTADVTRTTEFGYTIEKHSFYNLEPGTTYKYTLMVQKEGEKKASVADTGSFTTQTLWQWRTQAPDFSFLTGSCSFFNEPAYDRPGRGYGFDSSIFETMAKEKADFMLWLGDNWYTREVDYYSESGLFYRAHATRTYPTLQNFWKRMSHYAIWDDHDYGPNDADKSYVLKEKSRAIFENFWTNPSTGFNGQGIFSKFTWNDVDVFLLDDRYFRSNDDMADSINGSPNNTKEMFGAMQLDWLKNALLQSKNNNKISFRIIATGSQVLNPVSPFDCFRKFSKEYNDFLQFLEQHKIPGVVFFTGDRHHSEVIKVDRAGTYPLYDITSSPLTSGSHKFGGPEKDNPYRVVGVENIQNYSRISFTGNDKNRTMKVEFIDKNGVVLQSWSIAAAALRTK